MPGLHLPTECGRLFVVTPVSQAWCVTPVTLYAAKECQTHARFPFAYRAWSFIRGHPPLTSMACYSHGSSIPWCFQFVTVVKVFQ